VACDTLALRCFAVPFFSPLDKNERAYSGLLAYIEADDMEIVKKHIDGGKAFELTEVQ